MTARWIQAVRRVARTLLAACFFFGFGLGGVGLGCVLFPLVLVGGRGPRARRVLRGLVRAAFRLFVWCGDVTGLFRIAISAEDRAALAGLKGCVVVANHLTLIDVVVLLTLLPDATAVAKAAARRNPFYARIVSGAFLVNDDPEGVLREATERLSEGVNLLVFPEGTRTPADAPERHLHRGAARIACAAQAPVACLAFTCTPPVLARGQAWYDVGAETVVYAFSWRGSITPGNFPVACSARTAAVRLTDEMARRIWT